MWQLQLETGPSLRIYCPVAQESATHTSEPTPHKQPRSGVFRVGWVRGVLDHQDGDNHPCYSPPGLDHPRVPEQVGVVA
jgi:hypothetical protein